MKKLLYILIAIFAILLVSQDYAHAQLKSRTKGQKKSRNSASSFSKGYQDLTSRYNRYFNAKLLFTESIRTLSSANTDDYTDILTIFPYESGENAATVHSDMDAIIKKTSENIKLKPNSKWVDDSYLYLGKANYLKGDYETAIQSFQYVNSKFSNRKRLAGKKVNSSANSRKRPTKRPTTSPEAEADKKEKEEARKAKEKQRADEKKKREKDKKEKEKDRKKSAKERNKEIKQKKKQREKDRKKRAKAKKKRKKKKSSSKSRPAPKTAEERAAEKAEKEAAAQAEKDRKEAEKAEKEAEKAAKEAEELAKIEEEEAEAAREAAEQTAKNMETAQSRTYSGGGLFKHKLAKHEAMVWLARSYIDKEEFSNALKVLEVAQKDRKFPRKYAGDLNSLFAHYYLKKGDFESARPLLIQAIKTTRKKKNRARLHYILAQLNEQDKEYASAVNSFQKVLKSKPSFEMEFNAKINIAKDKMKTGDYSADRAIAYLDKMTKDDKYIDKKDQIYFVMSEIAMENGDFDQGFAYLEESAKNTGANNEQKAKTYLKIAEILYEQEQYLKASAYYDSTLNFLAKDYKDYDEIADRKEILADLATNFSIIEKEDSLLRIAGMSEAKRKIFLEELIEQLEEEARLAEEAKAQDAFATNDPKDPKNSGGALGQWYFYNISTKSKGYNDFVQQWGPRTLQDNWRTNADDGLGTSSEVAEFGAEILDKAAQGTLTVEDLMADLPLNANDKAAANERIMNAIFEMGNIYSSRLQNDQKAIEYFDMLLDRYPNSPNAAQAHYNLYLLHAGEPAIANMHKNTILKDFPNSEYAKLLNDPNYAQTITAKNKELDKYYEQTYALYTKGNYDEVNKRRSEVNSLFEPNPLQPKFDLLDAFVVGQTKDKAAYVNALKNVVVKHPEDEVKVKAEEILKYLDEEAKKDTKKDKESVYKYKPNSKHYFIIAFDGFTTQMSSVLANFSDLNNAEFSLDKLKVNQMLLDKENQIIIIKDFKDASKALAYYKKIKGAEGSLMEGIDTGYRIFAISKLNFSQYFKRKDAQEYFEFFESNYEL